MIEEKDVSVRQNRMSMGFLAVAIVVITTVQWMTLDMYLPALPVLKEEFAASEALLNLSLNSDLILCTGNRSTSY